MTTQSSCRLRVIGYCDKSEAELLNLYQRNDLDRLCNLRGEYTIIIEKEGDCCIITSPVGAMHYYYTLHNNIFYHGDRLLNILKQSQLAWQWNWRALGDLCQLENLTNNETLHPSIHRVPPGSILRYRAGRVDLRSKRYIDTIPQQQSSAASAVDALNQEVARWSSNNPYLSLSGGFDSRVILSSLLAQGIRPHLITMGRNESSDVKVAKGIASTFGLDHDLIKITLDDFLDKASTISALTNGTKTAWHWHTYLYPLKASIPQSSTFFVGTLGEFARCYYFDKGFIGQVSNSFTPYTLNRFWSLKLHRHPTFQEYELNGIAPELREQLSEEGMSQRVQRLSRYCHQQFLPGLTRYYFEQRVPNFYANGIKMYLASSQWRSPFHSREWINSIWNLSSSWKLGSNWHRYAIQSNFPALLEFPEENGFDRRRMLAKAPLLYWTPMMRRNSYVTYDMSSEWYSTPEVQDYLHSSLPEVDDLIDDTTAKKILEEHQRTGNRTRTIAFLLTMVYWKKNIKRV